ncbi:hypothetical protein [Actinokineospora fastidiosa]
MDLYAWLTYRFSYLLGARDNQIVRPMTAHLARPSEQTHTGSGIDWPYPRVRRWQRSPAGPQR